MRQQVEVGGAQLPAPTQGASMDADLDLLLTTVYCAAADLLPQASKNARRRVSDAELVTLCVAQAIMGLPSDRRFLAVAGKRLIGLFPELPAQPGYFKRRRRLAATIEWLMVVFASKSPGYQDDLLLTTQPRSSAPARARRSNAAATAAWPKRSATPATTATAPATPATSGASACTRSSRPTAPRRALSIISPKIDEREVGLELLARCNRHGGETLLGDKGYASKAFTAQVAEQGATLVRPNRRDEPGKGPHLAPIRQRIESIFWTLKDILTLERHGARTLPGLRERILQRLCCLAACVMLNHQLGRPSRALVDYIA